MPEKEKPDVTPEELANAILKALGFDVDEESQDQQKTELELNSIAKDLLAEIHP